MPSKIKICGITLPQEVEFINKMDVDYVGFLFAESKRHVDIDQARKLSAMLREGIKRCGVFVDHNVDEINEIAKAAKLDIAQVHRNYTPEMVAAIDIPVWYAVSVKDEKSIGLINHTSRYENVCGILADSYVEGQDGGTGMTFNWDLLSGVEDDVFLILAGGLNEENIEDAIEKAHPDVVDISSGAEITADGKTKKSEEKVHNLVRKVKGYV